MANYYIEFDSYFPAFGLFIGWPLIAEKVMDGHVV
jgi:hypothetical protein